MSDRDIELDAIERELRGSPVPHIEKPDDLAIHDGSSCFIDQTRACASDCRAYDTAATPGTPEVCVLLSSVMDVGDGLQPFISLTKTLTKARQDRARHAAASMPVPDPTGGKKT